MHALTPQEHFQNGGRIFVLAMHQNPRLIFINVPFSLPHATPGSRGEVGGDMEILYYLFHKYGNLLLFITS